MVGHICKSLSKRIARRTRKYTGAAYNGVRGQRGPTAQTAPHRRRQNPPQYLGGRVDLLDPIRVARLRLLLCAPAIAEDERSDEPEEADRAAEQNNGVTPMYVRIARMNAMRRHAGERHAEKKSGRSVQAEGVILQCRRRRGGGAYVVSRVLRRPCCCCVALSHVAALKFAPPFSFALV